MAELTITKPSVLNVAPRSASIRSKPGSTSCNQRGGTIQSKTIENIIMDKVEIALLTLTFCGFIFALTPII
jgi:hypothetical protein